MLGERSVELQRGLRIGILALGRLWDNSGTGTLESVSFLFHEMSLDPDDFQW